MRTEDRRRVMSGRERKFDGFLVRGKFEDDSTAEDWWLKLNGNVNVKTPISDFVDAETKTFEYRDENFPTSLMYLFQQNSSLETIESICGTENVKNFSYMFGSCTNLKDAKINDIDTSNGTTFQNMFSSCTNIIAFDGSFIDTTSATNISYMFGGCTLLEEVDLSTWNTDNVSTVVALFQNCTNLKSVKFGPKFTCKEATNLSNMFYQCKNLKSIDLSMFQISKVANLTGMFQACGVTNLDLSNFDTSNATSFSTMFSWATSLTELSVNFDFGKATSVNNMFTNCLNLRTIRGTMHNLKLSLSVSDCPLTADSAQVLIDGLSAEAAGQTITFSATTKALLSEEQKAQIAAKGWIMG